MKPTLLFLLFIVSCKEIIVEDISSLKVELISPSDSVTTIYQHQNFIWETIPGALDYRFSISKPGFDSIEIMVFDSVFDRTNWQHKLDPGNYQWRVRAQNSEYQTIYVTRSLQIIQ